MGRRVISLRWMMTASTLVALSLSLWGHSSRRRTRAVRELRSRDFSVIYRAPNPRLPSNDWWNTVASVLKDGETTKWPPVTQLRGLTPLAHLRNIESLSFRSMRIDREAARDIGGCRELRYLTLNRCVCSSVLEQMIRPSSSLVHLNLESTDVGDEAIVALSTLGCLEELIIENALVTEAGFVRLQELMPNCNIVWSLRNERPNEMVDPADALLARPADVFSSGMKRDLSENSVAELEALLEKTRIDHRGMVDLARARIVKAIGKVGGKAAVPILAAIIRDEREHWDVKASCVRGLILSRQVEAIPILIENNYLDDLQALTWRIESAPGVGADNVAWAEWWASCKGTALDLDWERGGSSARN